jgi:hypothetical protein
MSPVVAVELVRLGATQLIAADEELPPGYPREEIGLLPGDGDEYIITAGGVKGLRGFFTR